MSFAVAGKRLVLALSLSFVSSMAAAKVPIIFNSGDALYELGEYPPALLQTQPDRQFGKPGYKCAHLGLFWADIWRWNCTLVEMSGSQSYHDMPAQFSEQLRTDPQYGLSKTNRTVWNKYGFWVSLLLVTGFFGFRAFSAPDQD